MSEDPSPVAAARILVVDDEPAVCLSVERILRKLGYDVVTAGDGCAALDAMDGEHAIDLIVMDVTMPVMDGPTAARELRARGVDVPILLMSGYAQEELMGRGVMTHAAGFLKKPFEVPDLATAVRGRLVGGVRS